MALRKRDERRPMEPTMRTARDSRAQSEGGLQSRRFVASKINLEPGQWNAWAPCSRNIHKSA
jgi:hypothetical protein